MTMRGSPTGFQFIASGPRICQTRINEYANHAMQDTLTNEELMLNYRNGDAAAFELLYQRHKGPLYRYIMRQCDKTHVDELFQDIWLKLVNARNRYEVTAKFTTWLYRLAHNRIIDHYRRQNVRPVTENNESLPAVADNNNQQPENQAQSNEQTTLLLTAIQQLPHDQRDTFLLYEEAGLSLDEIAQATGVNFETAKSRLRYAIKKLRAQLEDFL